MIDETIYEAMLLVFERMAWEGIDDGAARGYEPIRRDEMPAELPSFPALVAGLAEHRRKGNAASAYLYANMLASVIADVRATENTGH